MVVTREGMPLGYEVFAGNRTDVTTVEEIVEAMEKRYGIAQRVWVMDRGMSSVDNVAWLQETGRELRIRCVVRPDKAQAMLLDRLGLRLPERLRARSHGIKM